MITNMKFQKEGRRRARAAHVGNMERRAAPDNILIVLKYIFQLQMLYGFLNLIIIS